MGEEVFKRLASCFRSSLLIEVVPSLGVCPCHLRSPLDHRLQHGVLGNAKRPAAWSGFCVTRPGPCAGAGVTKRRPCASHSRRLQHPARASGPLRRQRLESTVPARLCSYLYLAPAQIPEPSSRATCQKPAPTSWQKLRAPLCCICRSSPLGARE